MSSLGMLGEYGSVSSGSDLSDSDDEFEPKVKHPKRDHSKIAEKSLLSNCDRLEPSAAEERLEPSVQGDPLNYSQGDVSSSDSDEQSEEDRSHRKTEEEETASPLPLPDLSQLTGQTGHIGSSVFSNPFKEAEDAKLAMLKRHVSEFAADEKPTSSRSRTRHRSRGSHGNNRTRRSDHVTVDEATPTFNRDPDRLFNDDDSCVSESVQQGKRKKRSGVGNTLVPPKRFLKSYEKTRAEERPWTVTTT